MGTCASTMDGPGGAGLVLAPGWGADGPPRYSGWELDARSPALGCEAHGANARGARRAALELVEVGPDAPLWLEDAGWPLMPPSAPSGSHIRAGPAPTSCVSVACAPRGSSYAASSSLGSSVCAAATPGAAHAAAGPIIRRFSPPCPASVAEEPQGWSCKCSAWLSSAGDGESEASDDECVAEASLKASLARAAAAASCAVGPDSLELSLLASGRLGGGAGTEVHSGYHKNMPAAIKIMYTGNCQDKAMAHAFEMAVLTSAAHPAIIQAYACEAHGAWPPPACVSAASCLMRTRPMPRPATS